MILRESTSGAIQDFPGFSYPYTSRTSIRAVLNTLEGLTNVNVISSPKLLALNNHQAALHVSDQVPIVTLSVDGQAPRRLPQIYVSSCSNDSIIYLGHYRVVVAEHATTR